MGNSYGKSPPHRNKFGGQRHCGSGDSWSHAPRAAIEKKGKTTFARPFKKHCI